MPLFLRYQGWSSFDGKTPFPGENAMWIHCVLAGLFFFFFFFFKVKPCRNVTLTCLMFSFLTRHKTGPETLFL